MARGAVCYMHRHNLVFCVLKVCMIQSQIQRDARGKRYAPSAKEVPEIVGPSSHSVLLAFFPSLLPLPNSFLLHFLLLRLDFVPPWTFYTLLHTYFPFESLSV